MQYVVRSTHHAVIVHHLGQLRARQRCQVVNHWLAAAAAGLVQWSGPPPAAVQQQPQTVTSDPAYLSYQCDARLVHPRLW